MGIMNVNKKDLEVYAGKWFKIDDPETEKLQGLLSNGKRLLPIWTLAKSDVTQERLRELGFELIYLEKQIDKDRAMRWMLRELKK